MLKKKQPVGRTMKPSKTALGTFVRDRRLELDNRQADLAKRAVVSQGIVSKIETGMSEHLKYPLLRRFAEALQCDVEELRKRMPEKQIIEPTTEVGKLIRSRREQLGLSLSTFAEQMNMTAQSARNLELRMNPCIRRGLVKALTRVLDLDLSVLERFAEETRRGTASGLGKLIRSRRKQLGMPISALAAKLNVTREFVHQIEFGTFRLSKDDEQIAQLASVLELHRDQLEAELMRESKTL